MNSKSSTLLTPSTLNLSLQLGAQRGNRFPFVVVDVLDLCTLEENIIDTVRVNGNLSSKPEAIMLWNTDNPIPIHSCG